MTYEELDKAIQAHVGQDGSLVTDWILVAANVTTRDTNAIRIETSRANMPGYIATGILSEALNLQKADYMRVEGDDE